MPRSRLRVGAGRALAERTLTDGYAWKKFQRICDAQGGMRTPPTARLTHPIVATHSGRVTDSWDRRLLNVYIYQFFCEDAISIKRFPMSGLTEYFIPEVGDKTHYMNYIDKLPKNEDPSAFGQHANSDRQAVTTANAVMGRP